MNFVKSIEQYNSDHIFFCEPIKNNIMNDGNFIRIIYSNDIVTFNGIYISVDFIYIKSEKFYNKYKCFFDIESNKNVISFIKKTEEDILQKYKTNKIPSYKIYEQLTSGYIKFFVNINENQNSSLILKISGIWETDNQYGLTYKFCKVCL